MTETPDKDLFYACITHVPLWINFPSYVNPIYLGETQGDGRLNLHDLAPEWAPYHYALGSTAGSFAIKNYLLAHAAEVKKVGICQYRKFISSNRIGVPAQNYQTMDMLSVSTLKDSNFAEIMRPNNEEFMIGRPGSFMVNNIIFDYLYQYKDVHHIEDFLRFVAQAVEIGVLDKEDVYPFFHEKIFLPGGIELGVFPAAFWIQSISAIESVVRECIKRYDIQREGHQARVWSFCAERLGSYILLRHFQTQFKGIDWPQRFMRQLNLITQDGELEYLPGA